MSSPPTTKKDFADSTGVSSADSSIPSFTNNQSSPDLLQSHVRPFHDKNNDIHGNFDSANSSNSNSNSHHYPNSSSADNHFKQGESQNSYHSNENIGKSDKPEQYTDRSQLKGSRTQGSGHSNEPTTSKSRLTHRTSSSFSPTRLTRRPSFAALLNMFRHGHRDDSKGSAYHPVTRGREGAKYSLDHTKNYIDGVNDARSFSIPTPCSAQLPQTEAKRKGRRSSLNSDWALGSMPGVLDVTKKRPETEQESESEALRRCSLTLPYANLYGSWQSAASPTTSRTGSTDFHHTQPYRKNSSLIEMSHLAENMKHRNPQSYPHKQSNFLTKSASSDKLKTSSTLPLIIRNVSLEEALEEEGVEDEVERKVFRGSFSTYWIPRALVQLMVSSFQKVPMKDFGSEVRATMDIEHFLQSAVLMIDVQETTVEGITDMLLEKLLSQEEPLCSMEEARSILFTHDVASSNEKDPLSQVHLLSRTIQGTACSESGSFDYDQSWICALGNLPCLQRRHVAIARLKQPANMGRTSKQIKFFILILCPSKEKGTKNSLETGRTFATIFADIDFRQRLLGATTEEEFKRLIITHSQELAQEQQIVQEKHIAVKQDGLENMDFEEPEGKCRFARGIREDLERRLPHYLSDYRDGVTGPKTVQKCISTTFFLYFACILPAIAFGVLNDHNTNGKIDVKKVIIGQVIGGVFWGVFSGQPLLVQLTTAPLAIYIKIIFYICEDFKLDFHAMYCAVGLWNSFFLIIYSLFDVSRLMRWSTRSTEEIFALFISIAFCNDAFNDVIKNFYGNYYSESCQLETEVSSNDSLRESILQGGSFSSIRNQSSIEYFTNNTSNATLLLAEISECKRENSILFILLMFGTLWLGVMLYNFNKTPYLNANKREALADYALPVAVIVLSFIGSYIFRAVKLEHFHYNENYSLFILAPLHTLPTSAIFAAMGLGFSLSMLFFMDQNIGSAMVNNPCNKLKKGPAYHLDLFVVAVMNGFLSLFSLPWMHACLPHSPLHVRSLADVEERVDQGHVYEIIVKVRETRLTGLFSNILIGLSIFLLPYPLAYIPTAVLDGLFLYMAVTALNGNQMFERITLLFMEQAAYPPNHYIRRVPQRSIHKFTGVQVLQLLVMCSFGFAPWPYMKMMFPVLLLLLLPIRHKLVPKLIEAKYLCALDGQHQ